MPLGHRKDSDYNKKFFPITKVFLGNRMDYKRRIEIIEICKNQNISYVGVMRNSNTFEMQECKVKCEDCYKFKK